MSSINVIWKGWGLLVIGIFDSPILFSENNCPGVGILNSCLCLKSKYMYRICLVLSLPPPLPSSGSTLSDASSFYNLLKQ